MKERREFDRERVPFIVRVIHPSFGERRGEVMNMSMGGIYARFDGEALGEEGLIVKANIEGDGWDESLPPLTMEIVRASEHGVALQFVDPMGAAEEVHHAIRIHS